MKTKLQKKNWEYFRNSNYESDRRDFRVFFGS